MTTLCAAVWLRGQPHLEEYLAFHHNKVIGGDQADPRALAARWREANDLYYELEQEEAGIADGIECRPLLPELATCATEIEANAWFRSSFDNLPTTIELVELDKLVVDTAVRAGAAVLVPIFAQGRLTAGLRVAEADQVAAVEAYRQTVLGALAEVENLNNAVAASRERAALLGEILAEARLTADLSSTRYIEGEENLQVVLDAQQLLGDAEDAQVLGQQEQLFVQIALYRAMGGYRPGPAPTIATRR